MWGEANPLWTLAFTLKFSSILLPFLPILSSPSQDIPIMDSPDPRDVVSFAMQNETSKHCFSLFPL